MKDDKREEKDPGQSLSRRLVRSGCGIGILILLTPILLAWVLR